MTIFDMLEQSGILTLLGMGIVFGFLIVLVISVILTGKLIRLLVPQQEADTKVPVPDGKPNQAISAAISAAVAEYRKGAG